MPLNETSSTATGIVTPKTLALTTILSLTRFFNCLALASTNAFGVNENPQSITTTSAAVPVKVLTASIRGGLVPKVKLSSHNALTKAGAGELAKID